MSVTNPIEGFLDLLELRKTLNTTRSALKATKDALASLKRYEAQLDASTIKRLEIQVGKMENASNRAEKALSTATKKQLPKELADAYKKGMRSLKKTLPASVFGKPRYSYINEYSTTAKFYIIVPLQDYEDDLMFVLEIKFEHAKEGRRNWAREWIPAEPAKVVTKVTYSFDHRGYGKTDISQILEHLKNKEYIHYPNIAGIKAEKEGIRLQLEQDIKRLPSWVDAQVEESRGELYIEVEGRTDMRWEYDQDHMSWSEWEEQAQNEIEDTVKRIKQILPNYEYSSGGMGEKGHYTITLTPKK